MREWCSFFIFFIFIFLRVYLHSRESCSSWYCGGVDVDDGSGMISLKKDRYMIGVL